MSYCNQEIKRDCSGNRNYIFCANSKESPGGLNATLLSGNIGSVGILLQFFDLRETLIQKKIIKFYAKGFCMYPCVRPGDILHLEYRGAEEIGIGDIAVYRKGNNLFGHRVIDKGYQENRAYILTRSDTARGGSDGHIFNRDIAGIILSIERKKRILGPEKIRCSLISKIYLKFMSISLKLSSLLIKKPVHRLKENN